MPNRQIRAFLSAAFLGFLALGLHTGCAENSISGPTSPLTAGTTNLASTGFASGLVDENFNCTNVGDVRVRFSEPGFVSDDTVGLYVRFSRVPDTNRTLRVWWDYENAPGQYEDVELADGDVTRSGDLLEIEAVIEHSYDVSGHAEKRVRVELIMADLVGNCARTRDVTVRPSRAARTCSIRTKDTGNGAGYFTMDFAPETLIPSGTFAEAINHYASTYPACSMNASDWMVSAGLVGQHTGQGLDVARVPTTGFMVNRANKGCNLQIIGGTCGSIHVTRR